MVALDLYCWSVTNRTASRLNSSEYRREFPEEGCVSGASDKLMVNFFQEHYSAPAQYPPVLGHREAVWDALHGQRWWRVLRGFDLCKNAPEQKNIACK
jgi:hypothetical protein